MIATFGGGPLNKSSIPPPYDELFDELMKAEITLNDLFVSIPPGGVEKVKYRLGFYVSAKEPMQLIGETVKFKGLSVKIDNLS